MYEVANVEWDWRVGGSRKTAQGLQSSYTATEAALEAHTPVEGPVCQESAAQASVQASAQAISIEVDDRCWPR